LQDQPAGSDLPALTDERVGDVESGGGGVLAERSVVQTAPEDVLPGVQILARVGVDGLVISAV